MPAGKNFIELPAGIVSAYVGNNPTPAADIPNLISQIHARLGAALSGRQPKRRRAGESRRCR